jgi:hypothetical protein
MMSRTQAAIANAPVKLRIFRLFIRHLLVCHATSQGSDTLRDGSNWSTRQTYTLSGREGMSMLLFLACRALLAG